MIKVYPISYIIHFPTLPQQPTKKHTDNYNFTFSFPPTSISALQKTLKQTHLLLLFLFPNNHKAQPKYQTPIKSFKEKKKNPTQTFIYMWNIYTYLFERDRETEIERERSNSLRKP